MSKKFLLFSRFGTVALLVFLLPQTVLAAQIFFKTVPNQVPDDKAEVVEVRINPGSKVLNVVEGVIGFRGTAVNKLIAQVETGGSILTLWPTPPQYFPEEKIIRFTGGVPSGFNQEGLIFRLRLTSSLTGEITITWISGATYLNDGKGTAEGVSSQSITINLDQQSSEINSVSSDNMPPIFDMLEIGQDPSVYDGQYFISFHANDDVSGVARYEIREGQFTTNVTDGVYVFKDQKRKTPIIIIAYDVAGNSQSTEIPARYDWQKNVIISLVIIFLACVFYYGYKKIIKK